MGTPTKLRIKYIVVSGERYTIPRQKKYILYYAQRSLKVGGKMRFRAFLRSPITLQTFSSEEPYVL